MGVVVDLARALIPRRARRYLRERQRRPVLVGAMQRLQKSSDGLAPAIARDLVYGWANEKMSAREEFLQALYQGACAAHGPILECGSGLSTLLLGLAAQKARQRVWTLEHDAFWASRARAALERFGIDTVELCVAPLRSYGDYVWYDPPLACMPHNFALVICDGPPGTTPGGRYGLMPVLGAHLGPGCVILLDDATRDGEQTVLARWKRELNVSHEVVSGEKPYARLCTPALSSYKLPA
jgi:predicted O-methyltransferase YrrM